MLSTDDSGKSGWLKGMSEVDQLETIGRDREGTDRHRGILANQTTGHQHNKCEVTVHRVIEGQLTQNFNLLLIETEDYLALLSTHDS